MDTPDLPPKTMRAWEALDDYGLETGAETAREENTEWTPPVAFDEFELPSFPLEALSPTLREFAEAEAEATQTPPDLAAMIGLGVFSACAAKRVTVGVKSGYSEPVNLFLASMLGPGERKSQVFRDATAPVMEWEKEQDKLASPAIARAAQQFRLSEKRLRAAEEAAVRAKDRGERERLELEAGELAERHALLKIPEPPRILADDSTPEALVSLLAAQGGKMAIMSPEGGIFDILAGRYSDAPNLDPYLKGHAGDDLRVDRKGRPSEYVEAPALTVGLAVQPIVIERLAEKPNFRGTGLLARFLYSLPASRMGHRAVDPKPLSATVQSQYRTTVRRLLSLHNGMSLAFTPEAMAQWRQFSVWLEPQLSEFGALGPVRDWGSKLPGAIVRIVGILSLDMHFRDPSLSLHIDGPTFEQACAIGRYFIPHAQAAFQLMGADATTEDAKRVLRLVLERKWEKFSKRDLYQSLKGQERFRTADKLDRPLEILVQRGFVRLSQQDGDHGVGRPPSPTYRVNPLSKAHNPHNPQNSGGR